MPVDLDAPNRAALGAFGDAAQAGKKARYTPLDGPSFDLDGLFDEAWATIEIRQSRFGISPVSTTKPCFGVRLADFPAGVTPEQGAKIVRANGKEYSISDAQPDGLGWVYLSLNEIS